MRLKHTFLHVPLLCRLCGTIKQAHISCTVINHYGHDANRKYSLRVMFLADECCGGDRRSQWHSKPFSAIHSVYVS